MAAAIFHKTFKLEERTQENRTMENDFSSIRNALARAVADRRVSDEAIDLAAKQLTDIKYRIRGLDVCAYGICLDFILTERDWWQALPGLIQVDGGVVRGIEIFPWGIPWPDILRVRVTQSLDAIPQARI
jgi:hypothetical protein